jgi:WD40 repeat protein
MTEPNIFTVGGTVQANTYGVYIYRPADAELLKLCRSAEFTYVLTPRQMGKSSLMIFTAEQLIKDGIIPVIVDLQKIGTAVTAEAWYKGVLTEIADQLGLKTSVEPWWQKYSYLGVTQRLSRFFEKVIQAQVQQQVVVFVDEIDTTISLDFTDDFYAAIRSLYLARATQAGLQRLSFVLIGVATPEDLIQDKTRSPFNIGKSISLEGFTFHEAQPLAEGLVDLGNSDAILKSILEWTGGQPFLTQKVCDLAFKKNKNIPAYEEKKLIGNLVNDQIIKNWRSKDQPVHLGTIEKRIIYKEKHLSLKEPYAILRFYEKILQNPRIESPIKSIEEIELRQSGLVTTKQELLTVSNRIYEYVFNQEWISRSIANLTPYSELYSQWIKSGQDENFLLHGEGLRQAQEWAQELTLSREEHIFISKSKELEKNNFQEELRKLKEEGKISKKRTNFYTWIMMGLILLLALMVATIITLQNNYLVTQKDDLALQRGLYCYNFSDDITEMKLIDGSRYLAAADSNGKIKLLKMESECGSDPVPFEDHKDIVTGIKTNPKKDQIVSASLDGTVILSKADNTNRKSLAIEKPEPVTSIDFSPDGQYLAISTAKGTVSIWNTNTYKCITLIPLQKTDEHYILSIAFSSDGKYLAANSLNNSPKVWRWDKHNLTTMTYDKEILENNTKMIAFSPKDNHLAIVYTNGKILILELKDLQINKAIVPNKKAASLNVDSDIKEIRFSPDGKTLAIISFNINQSVRLWKWGKDQDTIPLDQQTIPLDGVSTMAFSPENQGIYLALARKDEIQLWLINDNDPNKFKGNWPIVGEPFAIEFVPDKQKKENISLVVTNDKSEVFKIDISSDN